MEELEQAVVAPQTGLLVRLIQAVVVVGQEAVAEEHLALVGLVL